MFEQAVRVFRRCLATALSVAIVMLSTPTNAAGSLPLEDVLVAVKDAPKLVAEIKAELARSGLSVQGVVCVGARHGRHWIYLGGARAAPYTCRIGKREVRIEADRVYFNANGRKLGDVDHASPQKAKTFQESDFRWTWSN